MVIDGLKFPEPKTSSVNLSTFSVGKGSLFHIDIRALSEVEPRNA